MSNNDAKELVSQAKQSFENVLANEKYAGIIKDDKHLQLILGMLDVKEHDQILDIGTGNGYLAFPLAKLNPTANVIGIDIAENIVEKNNEKAKSNNLLNVSFVAFDGIQYPFDQNTFDWAVTRYALHHFPEIEGIIQNIADILKTGAHILVADPLKNDKDMRGIIDAFMGIKRDGHVSFYTKKKLQSIFAKCGMKIEKQIISTMKFPFPSKPEYIELFNVTSQEERDMYQLEINDGIVWVGNIEVGNTLFVKK